MTVRAHYDGHHICLDEPIDLQSDMQLLVTVIQPGEEPHEAETEAEFRRDWRMLSKKAFARLYENEEREYGPEHIIKPNPYKNK